MEEGSFLADVVQEGNFEQSDDNGASEQTQASPTEKSEGEGGASPSHRGENPEAQATDNTDDVSKVPFHKHPRWQEMQREREALKAEQQALKQELESLKAGSAKAEQVKLPESWVIRYGDGEDSKAAYQKYVAEEIPNLKAEILKEIREERLQAERKEQEFVKWVDDEVSKVSEANGVDFKSDESLKNEFLAFMNKRRPTNEKGDIDFMGGWEWFNESRQPKENEAKRKQEERKKAASLAGADTKPESKKDEPISPKRLRNMGWTDLY